MRQAFHVVIPLAGVRLLVRNGLAKATAKYDVELVIDIPTL